MFTIYSKIHRRS